jgi:LAS seventeen-binding protein 5
MGQEAETPNLQKKPYTAVTVHVDNLTSEAYEVDDISGIPDLVEVIRIQDTGPTEAARAIRKKLSAISIL